MNHSDEPTEYTWAELRRLRTATAAAVVAFVPGSLLVAVFLERWLPGEIAFLIPVTLAATVYMVFGTRLVKWPCPRCGHPFSVPERPGRHWPFANACKHCDLPIYSGVPKPPGLA
jgi:hypothetical protein